MTDETGLQKRRESPLPPGAVAGEPPGVWVMDKKKILLVDDVKFFLEQQKTLLARGEFDFLVARNGVEALKIVQDERPDLIFMDLHMPQMDGDKCCRAIKNDVELRRIPVVMVTAESSEMAFERCWQAGCDDIIVKPLNRVHFALVADRFLNVKFRRSSRFAVRLGIGFHPGQDARNPRSAVTGNLSTGGVFIETADILPVDESICISLDLPGTPAPVTCTGRVAWLNHSEDRRQKNLPAGMGVQFIDLSLDGMNAIRQFVKSEGLFPSW